MPRRTLSTARALDMRARRAPDDPLSMTTDATLARLANHVVALHEENPDLTAPQLAKGARLRLKAEMAVLGERAAKAKRDRAASRKAAAGNAA